MDELCDEADNDCDGLVDEGVTQTYYEDYDGDGFGDPNLSFSVQACDLPEEPTRNGGVYVANGDDCTDLNVEIHPEAQEVCDEQDNNCDGDIDENCACAPLGGTRACGPAEGICVQGYQDCNEEGWSPCDGPSFVPPEPRESCNALDDDCDGIVDEGLADDGFEPNDACTMARRLPNVLEGSPPVRVENATLHHGDPEAAQDQDWYIYTTREAFHLDCLDRFLEPQCNFIFEAGLRIPDGVEPNSYVMCLYENGCGGPRFCTNDANGPLYDAANRTWVLRLNAPGTCGLEDNKTFAVQVFYDGNDEASNTCETYDLAFVFGFIQQECGQ